MCLASIFNKADISEWEHGKGEKAWMSSIVIEIAQKDSTCAIGGWELRTVREHP